MDGFMPVKVMVPLADYKRLYAEAQHRGITVAQRIEQVLAPPKHGGRRNGTGYRSGYTPAAGEEISANRRFGVTWRETSRQLGISEPTARTWLRKYENEVREQNMRERAERRTA